MLYTIKTYILTIFLPDLYTIHIYLACISYNLIIRHYLAKRTIALEVKKYAL